MHRLRSPHVGMLLVVAIWGGNFTASKLAFPSLPPLAFNAIRFSIGSVLLWFVLERIEPGRSTPPDLWRPLLVLGVVGNTLYQLCFIIGLSRTTATNTSLILSAMPTVVTVAAGLLEMEQVTRRQRWALGLATLGVVVVVGARGFGAAGGDWVGDFLILGAVACWTGYTLGVRQLKGQITALRLTAWTMMTGTPGLVLAGLPSLARLDWGRVGPAAWGGLAYATMLSLVAAYLMWSHAVQRLGASRASLYSCLTPLVATLIAMVVLGEQPTPLHLLGGGLIVSGVVMGNAR